MDRQTQICSTKERSIHNFNPETIRQELEKVLRQGFVTRYGGGFLLTSYFQQLGIDKEIDKLDINKTNGIPPIKLCMAIMNHAIFGGKRLFRLENSSINDPGLAVLSGLAKLPTDTVAHDFLDSISAISSDKFWQSCSERFVKTGLIVGRRVILDKKFIPFWGKIEMRKDQHATRHINMKGIDLFITYDLDGRCCIYKQEDYPGNKPSEVGILMIDTTDKIVDRRLEWVVMDKLFCIGELLDYLNRTLKIEFITALKLYKKRIREMKEIPAKEFRSMADGRKITFIHTKYKNYSGKLRLVVIRFEEDGGKKYYGYLTNDEESPEELILQGYNQRQNIENFLDETSFLNLEKLPGIRLNEVSIMLSLKMIAFNILSSFRRDLGNKYRHLEIEGLYEKFLDNQAMVTTRGRVIKITFFRHKMHDVIAPLYMNLSEQLKGKNIDSKIPWLNNRILEFEFK